ncbi:hypothetical protein N7495_001728 [Penicillium taxi]|uniref:uncharacterized protein n=1 Tax=Penicillium taxi TaxID=168475 RepID=UPI0025450C37|nr:uncharacterized protein N7495_001728 [Penicillium taxi]KAJ5909046.1 hypothetical protein N7495_001728 [Penicillium taxi]
MAASRFQTEMYAAEKLVESAGTVLFRLSTREVCILRLLHRDEYILPKGRRNLRESRPVTAIRETTEETGIPCRLLPVNLISRVCPAIETEDLPDEARLFKGCCEPIVMQIRHIGENEIKLIWWFVAAVNEDEPVGQHEHKFEVEFHSYDEVLEKLTFKDDRELVKKAIELVKSSGGCEGAIVAKSQIGLFCNQLYTSLTLQLVICFQFLLRHKRPTKMLAIIHFNKPHLKLIPEPQPEQLRNPGAMQDFYGDYSKPEVGFRKASKFVKAV